MSSYSTYQILFFKKIHNAMIEEGCTVLPKMCFIEGCYFPRDIKTGGTFKPRKIDVDKYIKGYQDEKRRLCI